MKEFIDRLSLGIVAYDTPQMKLDTEEITISLMSEQQKEGCIRVENCGEGTLKGVVYSSDSHFKLKTEYFKGNRNLIRYHADAFCVEAGTTIQGVVTVVSNGGEQEIPFKIEVVQEKADTSIGEINELDSFVELAKKENEEALRLFCSARFSRIFLKENYNWKAKYDGLIQGQNKQIAMEEFLIGIHKKKAVNLLIKETEKYYENPEETYRDKLVLEKDHWGYVHVELQIDGDFIKPEKKEWSGPDFIGNICEIPYVIDRKGLRPGNHYGTITVKSLQWEQKIHIRIHIPHKEQNWDHEKYLTCKREMIKLYHTYLNFRMKKIKLKEWEKKSLNILSVLRRTSDDALIFRLFQAQIMTIQGKKVESRLILEEAENQLEGNFQKDVMVYCYYLYVRALFYHNVQEQKRAREIVQDYYKDRAESWQLLWILFYIDDNYDRNESLKLIRMKEQYNRGMRSPLMYYESLMVYNETPSLLRVMDDYEKQVIAYGISENYISEKLSKRVLELCEMERNFDRGLFRILTGLYQLQPDSAVLTEIVGMLIKGTKTEQKYFPWYEKAVEHNLKITGLYEYYMHSIPFDYEGKIPEVILLYFVYNITLKGERLDFLYKKVIEYREEMENIYRLYRKNIEWHVRESILQGRINDKLAVVYKDLMKDIVPSVEYLENIPDLLNTYLVICDNPEIRELIVVHKETKTQERIPFLRGRAYARIFSTDAALVFADVHGNRFLQAVNYRKQHLWSEESLLNLCYEANGEHFGLLLYLNDQYLHYGKYRTKAAEIMEKLIRNRDIRQEYKHDLQQQMIAYYAGTGQEEVVHHYLKYTDISDFYPEAKKHMIELCIRNGLYQRAFVLLSSYPCRIDNKLLFKCVDAMIRLEGERKTLVELALKAFRNGTYNECTLDYLCRNYDGPTAEMQEIWKKVKNFQCESRELEEKILVQMLFTGVSGSEMDPVFASYLLNGAGEKVKSACLIQKAYNYFVKYNPKEEYWMESISKALSNRENVHYLCMLAWLKDRSGKETLNGREIEIAKEILQEMWERQKVFAFYQKFSKYFELPFGVEEHCVLEYRTNPDSEVLVQFREKSSEAPFRVRQMKHVCYGIFTCEFLLFSDETIEYMITERNKQVEQKQLQELSGQESALCQTGSQFERINHMIYSMEHDSEQNWKEEMTSYYLDQKLNESIFTIM